MISGRDLGSDAIRADAPLAAACDSCAHFDAAAEQIEAGLPGLRTLSSAFASVRVGDGLCRRHDRYVAASSVCALHRHRVLNPPEFLAVAR
jgi:hypothetical protein